MAKSDDDLGGAREKRDRHFRRKLLEVLQLAASRAPMGTLIGDVLVAQVNDQLSPARRVEDEVEALRLCRSLVAAGLFREELIPKRKKWQTFGLEWVRFGLTDAGERWVKGEGERHPLIDDDFANDE